MDMKLDYKKTFKVGLAFLGVMLFWEVYDYAMPLLLTRTYGLSATWRGLIMGLDNLLAIFLLPFFGSLSDKAEHKKGKRTIFILVGTITAVILMFTLGVVEHLHFNKVRKEGFKDTTEVLSLKINHEKLKIREDDERYDCETYGDYIEKIAKGVMAGKENALTDIKAKKDAKSKFLSKVKPEEIDKTIEGIERMAQDGKKGMAATYEDFMLLRTTTADVGEAFKLYTGFDSAQTAFANALTKKKPAGLIIFMVILLLLLVAMSSYRSPAVALMPDVTPKPLRSRANAVINFMGGVGGALAMLLYTVFAKDIHGSYIMLFTVCGLLMLIALELYKYFVHENKFVKMRLAQEKRANYIDVEEEEESVDTKLPKDKVISLILILATVFFWFFGFNAMKSHLSPYLINELGFKPSDVAIITAANGVGAVIALVPVGFVSEKIGRKKSIMIGLIVGILSFAGMFFVKNNVHTKWLFAVLFVIAGVALVVININTLPMAVELSTGKTAGKFTGYYYVASMVAQAVTPFFAGLLMDSVGSRWMFVYGAVFMCLAIVTMVFTKHGDAVLKTNKNKKEKAK